MIGKTSKDNERLPFLVHVGSSLHVDPASHVMKAFPTSEYPVLQLMIATSPYVVPFGVSAEPSAGAGLPQSTRQTSQ